MVNLRDPVSASIGCAPGMPIDAGTTVVLTAAATNAAAPLSYAWTRNGLLVSSGATLGDSPPAGSVSYAVTVTDAQGSPNATPELDSLVLVDAGLLGLARYGQLRRRGSKNS